jgi:hypothetical protein
MTGRIETREQVRAELRRLLADMTRKGPVKQSDIIAVFNDSFELSRAVERELVNDALKADLTRLGQPDGISPSRMAEMLEVDKAGSKVRC